MIHIYFILFFLYNYNMVYDFIIIGAGISGLYSNYLLKKNNNNLKILILESSNRIGGRIFNEGNCNLGAKFLHNNIDKFTNHIDKNNMYHSGKLEGNNEIIQESMRLEESGSISKNIHHQFQYTNEVNYEYDFNKIITKYKNGVNIKFNTPYKKYFINKESLIIVNDKFTSKKIIFALPINVLKIIDNPYKEIFNNWFQSNIITLSFEFKKENNNLKDGFFYDEYFKKTSFFYNKKKNILYVNLFDRNKDLCLTKTINELTNHFSLNNYYLNYKKWVEDENLLGGWSIPKNTLNQNKIEIIEKGYQDIIYYVGDYLGIIGNIGSVTNAIYNVEKLIDNLKIKNLNNCLKK